jgi:nucleoside-diphosphate kinase
LRTLVLVKPDGVKRNLVGACLTAFEEAGLRIAALKMLTMSRGTAQEFYRVHRGRPFFESLVAYMTSGPVVAAILEGEDAVRRTREVMGATDPAEAAPGTLRARFGESLQCNTVHGSDGEESVDHEAGVIFGSGGRPPA